MKSIKSYRSERVCFGMKLNSGAFRSLMLHLVLRRVLCHLCHTFIWQTWGWQMRRRTGKWEERDWVGDSLSIRRAPQTVWSRHCLSGSHILYVLLHKHMLFFMVALYCVKHNKPHYVYDKFHYDVYVFLIFCPVSYRFKSCTCFALSSPVSIIVREFSGHICG